MKHLFPNAAAVVLAVAMPAYAQTSNTKPAATSAAEANCCAAPNGRWLTARADTACGTRLLKFVSLPRRALRHHPSP